jgi:cobaltochelatase CobN
MRQGSVSDDVWNEIAAIYVKDKLSLSLRQWFEAENPFAYQDMSEVLLESSRKGFWNAEAGLLREVAEQYARSVVRHGEGGGLRGGGNQSLEQFVAATLQSANSKEMDQLAVQYQARIREAVVAGNTQHAGTAPGPGLAVKAPSEKARHAKSEAGKQAPSPPSAAAEVGLAGAPTAVVRAQRLEPAPAATSGSADQTQVAIRWPMSVAIATVCIVLFVCGFCFRRGLP